ncbi:hypothetical protein NSI01_46000 [Pimelobacter simplex]|nr:hypothetical protein NSI01_46000 [Pimelobacter simplex]
MADDGLALRPVAIEVHATMIRRADRDRRKAVGRAWRGALGWSHVESRGIQDRGVRSSPHVPARLSSRARA